MPLDAFLLDAAAGCCAYSRVAVTPTATRRVVCAQRHRDRRARRLALIVGASLLMRVDTPFRILGYPGLAMLLFLAAAAGGFWLVIGTYVQDRKSEKKAAR